MKSLLCLLLDYFLILLLSLLNPMICCLMGVIIYLVVMMFLTIYEDNKSKFKENIVKIMLNDENEYCKTHAKSAYTMKWIYGRDGLYIEFILCYIS